MKQRTIYRVTEEWMKLRINDLEYKEAKHSQSEQEQNRIQNKEDSVSSFWDNFKRSNIRIIGVPEREEKEQEIGNLFEKIIKENFPNLVRDLQPKYLFPARISFRLKDQIKNFPDKKKLKDFITTKPLLYEILKGLI